ncbi:aspartate/glutamate racemase family protein [Isoalcanivorax pacificus]|nr:amino acid racemase [Isoalcanivorax pacificus]
MRHIGIAAVTAEGAALVYKEICRRSAIRLGEYQHPEISLHSFSFSEHMNGGPIEWARLLSLSASKLHATGAEFMICPSNTPHEVYEELASQLPLPWLHIASGVRAMAESKRLKNILLLGTEFTMKSRIYDDQFMESGISLTRPDELEVASVHEIITKELINGRLNESSRSAVSDIVRKYVRAGVDGVILGCTELPMIVDISESEVPLLDSTIALADAAIDYAIS